MLQPKNQWMIKGVQLRFCCWQIKLTCYHSNRRSWIIRFMSAKSWVKCHGNFTTTKTKRAQLFINSKNMGQRHFCGTGNFFPRVLNAVLKSAACIHQLESGNRWIIPNDLKNDKHDSDGDALNRSDPFGMTPKKAYSNPWRVLVCPNGFWVHQIQVAPACDTWTERIKKLGRFGARKMLQNSKACMDVTPKRVCLSQISSASAEILRQIWFRIYQIWFAYFSIRFSLQNTSGRSTAKFPHSQAHKVARTYPQPWSRFRLHRCNRCFFGCALGSVVFGPTFLS